MTDIYDLPYTPSQRQLKEKIKQQLEQSNKKGLVFDEIIKNYSKLYEQYINSRSLAEKSEISRKSINLGRDSVQLSTDMNRSVSILQEELAKTKNVNQENWENLNKNLIYTMELREKLDKFEKEIALLRPENESLKEKSSALTKRNKDLDTITKTQEKQIIDYRKTIAKLEEENRNLNESLNKLMLDNNSLTNKILTLQENEMKKINDYNEWYASAQEKKRAADLYFGEQAKEFTTKISSKIPDFQCNVEEVKIPKKMMLKTKPHNKSITSITFNSFGSNFLTTGADSFIKNWDTSKYNETAVFSGFTGAVSEACFDQSEEYLFGGSVDKTAKLWSLKNNKLWCTFTGHIDYINCVNSFYSSVKALTGSSDRTIKEWDFQTQKLSRNFSCVSGCYCLGIAYDDSYILSGHLDGTLKLWSSNTKPEKVVELHDDRILHMEILKNENQVLTISKDYTIKLFDIRKMETVYTISDKTWPQYCESTISISSDKKYFTIGSVKGQIYVCNWKDGSIEDTIDNKTIGSILTVKWRPFQSQLYVGDSWGYLTVWGTKK